VILKLVIVQWHPSLTPGTCPKSHGILWAHMFATNVKLNDLSTRVQSLLAPPPKSILRFWLKIREVSQIHTNTLLMKLVPSTL